MNLLRKSLQFLFVLTAGLISAEIACAESGKPVVLELFTTQGCATCPPADKLIKELSEEDADLITLGCHVTYFDSPLWKNTLSQPFCVGRHYEYHTSLNLGKIATPQLIINGLYETEGADEKTVRSAIQMVKSLEKLADIRISSRADYLDIMLPEVTLGEDQEADVWLFAYERLHSVDIPGGQNEGIKIEYINAVKHLVKLLKWDGTRKSFAIPVRDMKADGYAVIAQYKDQGAIFAAGNLKIPDQP